MVIKSSQDLRTFQDIEEWLARLNREWPQRREAAHQIAGQVAGLPAARPRVVELACGSGYLAEFLVRALPDLHYVGFDRSPHLLDYARKQIGTLAGHTERAAEIHLHQADLNEEEWIAWLQARDLFGQIDAVVSLQSLHDLGAEAEQRQMFRRVATVLRPGGLFAYADLLLDPENPHPRRLPGYRHLDLLRETGFAQVNCPWQRGAFALFTAVAR